MDSGIGNEKKHSKMKQSENREIFEKGSIEFHLSFIVQKEFISKCKKMFHVIIEESKANFSLFLLNTIDAIRYACSYFPNAYT